MLILCRGLCYAVNHLELFVIQKNPFGLDWICFGLKTKIKLTGYRCDPIQSRNPLDRVTC